MLSKGQLQPFGAIIYQCMAQQHVAGNTSNHKNSQLIFDILFLLVSTPNTNVMQY